MNRIHGMVLDAYWAGLGVGLLLGMVVGGLVVYLVMGGS